MRSTIGMLHRCFPCCKEKKTKLSRFKSALETIERGQRGHFQDVLEWSCVNMFYLLENACN